MAFSVFQIIPLRRLPPKFELLDYDFPTDTPPPEIGEVVMIPFAKTTLQGVVWAHGASVTGHTAKRKVLQRQAIPTYITPQQIGVIRWLWQETLTPLPTIVLSMLPTTMRVPAVPAQEFVPTGILAPHLADREQIIQQFAKRSSQKGRTVVFIPALPYAQTWQDVFGTRCAILHGKLTDRQKEKLLVSDTDVLVATAVGLNLPHASIRHVILDQADDDGYFAFNQAPRVDIRRAVRELCRMHAAPLTLIARWQSPTLLGTFPTTAWRGRRSGGWTIIDRNGEAGEQRRSPIAAGLLDRVQAGKTLWLVHRRSEAGHIRCQDCGSPLQCPTCARLLQVKREGTRQILFCPQDKTRSLVPDTCPRCKSARLSTQGKGLAVIAAEIEAQLSQKVTVLDAGTTLERTVQKNVVATTAIANYPEQQFDRAVIVRTESFLAPGNYRATEELHGVLALARQQVRVGGEYFCQTFQPDNAEFATGNVLTEREESTRTVLHYPPFGTLVVLQPRVRVRHASVQPFTETISKELHAIEQRTGQWLVRCAALQRTGVLKKIHEQLDASWEAIVDPPRIPAD